MALKTLVAAGIAALSMAFVAQGAEAKTKVIIGIGTPGYVGGGYCWNHPYRCRPAPRPLYYNYYVNPGPVIHYSYRKPVGKLSCGSARNIVDSSGFNKVAARDCSGPVYTFTASRAGKRYVVKVNAFSGRIIGSGRI